MKKLLLLLTVFLFTSLVFAGKVVTKKDSLLQISGTDSIWQIAKGTSAQFVTDKVTFRFNKIITIAGDTVITYSTLEDSLGAYVDTLTNQNIYGVKVFYGTVIAPSIKMTTLYNDSGLVLISNDNTTTTISRGDTVLLSQTKDLVKYNGVNSESLIEATDTTFTFYNPKTDDSPIAITIDSAGITIPNDTLIVNKVLKVDSIYTITNKPLIVASDTTLAIYNPKTGSAVIECQSHGVVLYDGYDDDSFVDCTSENYIIYGTKNKDWLTYTPTTTTISRGDTTFITMADTTIRAQKNLVAPKFYVSALNEAPASATAEGTTGEIRITTNYIYVCVSDDVWVRTELTTWP